jgi:hypothetical protein
VAPRVKKRKRGGASIPCPQCDTPSSVQVTRRSDTESAPQVTRWRKCKKRSCAHEFRTTEKIAFAE